nr:hypothetical protein [Tanacetum cinerariifolium]
MMTSDQTTNRRNEILNFQQRFDESFHEAWDRYKDLLRVCPHHGFTELHQLDTFYNALNPTDQDSLNAAAGGNLLERRTQDVLTIIENKSNVLNQQTRDVTTALTAILKQFQVTPPPASVKAVEEICVTCGGAHPYYQFVTAGGNTFPELRDNIQGYVSTAAVNCNQGELKAITTQSGLVLDGPIVPTPPPFINPEEDEHVEETLTDPYLSEDPIHPNIPYPSRMLKQKQQEKDEVQIHKFWQMFKQLHINITFADALILMPKYQKMLKALLSNNEKLQELANTPLNENCSAVILKKLLKKLRDPRKFLIPCGFSELKCKALVDLGASINLMPLSVWKKLGLPQLIVTRMTLELANQAICTPGGIARDVFIPIGKFTFLVDFVIVDYESDLRVPLILGRPFLWTARPLIDVHESIHLINVFNNSSEDFLEDLFSTNQPSGNPTFSSHPELTLPEVQDDIFDLEGGSVLREKLLDLDSTKDLHPPLHINPLSGSTTYSSSPSPLLEELDIDSSLKDSSNLVNPADNFVDSMPEMFTNEHALDYSSPPIFNEYDNDLFEVESDAENVYDDPFDPKGEKIEEVDALPSSNNEDKIFNPSILSQENPFEIITRVVQDNKLATSNASLVLEDFDC